MNVGVNATAVSSVCSPTTMTTMTTTTTTTTTSTITTTTSKTITPMSTMTTTLECRVEPETPSSPSPRSPPSHHETTKSVRKHKKYVHTSEGTFLWIDGKKIRSALTHKKWPPRPRRVSFPINDTDLITGYLEPANPWEHAQNVNIEDLISSYKTSCERHCTEPLPYVLAQLEKLHISDDERCPELCLKNESLDQHRCEPLEEILKRVQFEKLDLEATSLDDESAVILFDMLEYYQSAKHLDMSNNRNIGARGWHACAHMIKKTTCLEILEARDITLTQQHMNILKRPLQLAAHLNVLKLENCGLAGRVFASLVSALKMNTGLKELYLADNGLEQEDAIQLGALLRVNNHLQLLDISNNHIKDEGVRDILDGLITQSSDDRDGKGLSILVLWNNDLTKSSSGHFTQAIAHSITLETLNIGKNSVSNELLEMAQEALIKNCTLLQLGMQSTNITCKGALLLAEIVERNHTLQRIDLRDNNIQMTGLTALSFAMKKNMNITQLDLDDKPWSKSPATMLQYLDLVAEIRSHCARNDEEPTSADESTENSSSPQHRSRLSSVSSRKISLTCQTLPRSPPSMTPTSNETATRSMLEPKRTSGGRLRSPAPSPISSPVASPIPSPSRSRFVVSRVSETSLSSTNSSTSSSPVTPPSFASSSTCFFPAATGGSSRFRVVTVVEPTSKVPPAKSIVPSANTNVTIGFNYRVYTPESMDTDDLDSAFRSDVNEANNRVADNESDGSIDIDVSFEEEIKTFSIIKPESANDSVEDLKVELEETALIKTKEIRKNHPEPLEHPKMEDNKIDSVEAEAQRSDNETPPKSTSDSAGTSVTDDRKAFEQPEVTRIVQSLDSEIIETKVNSEKRAEQSLSDDILVSFKPEPKKSEPVQRQVTSLERLLGLFQHPGSLFSGSSFAEKTESTNPLQDGVNSMIALGDKFQQYLREGRAPGKSGTKDSPSHAPLQRSVSDASRSTIKLDPVKSLSIPQLSSIQATCTRDFASYKDGSKIPENSIADAQREVKSDIVNPTTPTVNPIEGDKVPRISDDPMLPETVQSSTDTLEEVGSNGTHVSNDAISPDCKVSPTGIINSASLKVASESKTTICAPKLKDIPEYSVLDTRTSNAQTDKCARHSSRDVKVDRRAENDVKMKCDSSTTDSINGPSYKSSSLCKVTGDISGVKNLHTLGTTDNVHNFVNAPLSHDGKIMLETPEEFTVLVVSSSEADELSTAIAAQAIKNINNIKEKDGEHSPMERPRDSSETARSPDTTKLEDTISNEANDESSRMADPPDQKQTIVANNLDLSLPVLYNLCTNRIDTGSRNAENDRVSGEETDEKVITTEDNELPDRAEAFSLAEPTAIQEITTAVLANNCTNNNSYADDLVTVSQLELDIANEIHEDNILSCLTGSAVVIESKNKIPAIDEIIVEDPITISKEYASLPNAICAKNEDAITKIEIVPTEDNDDDFVPTAAIEQVSNSLSEDSDYSSKLSVDDGRTGVLSLNVSTANSPANDDTVAHNIVAATSVMNNNLEYVNIHSEETSVKTMEHRSFVCVAVESVITSIMNASNSATKVTTSEVKSSESTEDLIFKITDITTDGSLNANEVTIGIDTTVQESEDPTNSGYSEPGQSLRSLTNLYIDKSRNVHRNSQDSGIEETTVSMSEDNGLEGNSQKRESFQESMDSGIDSECSSVCARVDVGADVQKERARDPGKSMILDPTSISTNEGILATDTIAKIGKPIYKLEIQDTNSSTKLAEVINVGRNNEAINDRPNISVHSTSSK